MKNKNRSTSKKSLKYKDWFNKTKDLMYSNDDRDISSNIDIIVYI